MECTGRGNSSQAGAAGGEISCHPRPGLRRWRWLLRRRPHRNTGFFSLGSSISILLIGGKALVGEIFVRRGEPQPERTFWIYRNRPLSKMHMIVFFGGLFIAVPGIASGDWIGGLLNVNTATAEMYVKASAAGGAVGGWWWLWLKFLTSENGSRIFHRDRAMPSSTGVGSILNQFPGPVTLYPSRRKWLLVLAGCVLFVVAGLWMVQREAPVGWLGVIFFGMGAIVSTAVLLLRVNALTLDGAGFEINSIRPFRLFWQDAKNFEAITLSPGSWMVGIKVVNPSDRSIFKLNRAISGCDDAIPDTYGLSAYDLTALMTQWRERATATPQRIT